LGLYWDESWDELKGLLGAERWVKRRLISVKQLCYTPSGELPAQNAFRPPRPNDSGGWFESCTQTTEPNLVLGEKGIGRRRVLSPCKHPKLPNQRVFNLAARNDCPTVFPTGCAVGLKGGGQAPHGPGN
jgi:hypothetical protein